MSKSQRHVAFTLVELLAFLALAALVGCGMSEEDRQREENRRAALTPEERQVEDVQIARAEAESKRKHELSMRELYATSYSEDCVRAFLKHPNDASFGFWTTPVVAHNAPGDIFTVRSKVKAKNDFGAALTYEWAAIVTCRREDWELVSCVIDGKTVFHSTSLFAVLETTNNPAPTATQAKAVNSKPKPAPEWRVWRSTSGKFELEAQFVSRAGNAMKLATKDGQTLTVAVDLLSEEDRKWLQTKRHP